MNNQEIEFIKYFEEKLHNKHQASFDVIEYASKLAGRNEKINCPSCGRNEYYELLNVYNRLLTAWEQYKFDLTKPKEEPKPIEPEPIYTKFEEEVKQEKPKWNFQKKKQKPEPKLEEDLNDFLLDGDDKLFE